MYKITKIFWVFFIVVILSTCTGGRGEKVTEETDGDDSFVTIPSIAVSLQFPANSPELGFYDITYTLSSSPKAQGPFNKVSYSASDAASYTLTDIAVKGTRTIDVKIEDTDGQLRYRGSGSITESSTSVTITLAEDSAEDPTACDSFTAEIDSFDPESSILEAGAPTGISVEINNPNSDDVVFEWSVEGGSVSPTDEQDTTFTAPTVTTETIVYVTLKIKPAAEEDVTCDTDKVSITVKPITPLGDPGAVTLYIGTSKTMNDIPAVWPESPVVQFEAAVVNEANVNSYTYEWYENNVRIPNQSSARVAYTVPQALFDSIGDVEGISCIEVKYKVKVAQSERSDEKPLMVCNKEPTVDTICESVSVSMPDLSEANLDTGNIDSLQYFVSLAVENKNPEMYTVDVTEFGNKCDVDPCGTLEEKAAGNNASGSEETKIYIWKTAIEEGKDNILYDRSRQITFKWKYINSNQECDNISLTKTIKPMEILPAVGKLRITSGTLFSGDSIPIPNVENIGANQINDKCIGFSTAAEFRSPKYAIDVHQDCVSAWETAELVAGAVFLSGMDLVTGGILFGFGFSGALDCSEDMTYRHGFRIDKFGLGKTISQELYIAPQADASNFWWKPEEGKRTPLLEVLPRDAYKNYGLAICYDVEEDSEYVAPSSFSPAPIDTATYPYLGESFVPERKLYFKPNGFVFYADNTLLPNKPAITAVETISEVDKAKSSNMKVGHLFTPTYVVSPRYNPSPGGPYRFGIENITPDGVTYMPHVRSEELDWAYESDNYPDNDLDQPLAGFRADQMLIGFDKRYSKHITVFREDNVDLLSSGQITIPDPFTAEDCSILPAVKSIVISEDGSFDPAEDGFIWNFSLGLEPIDDTHVKITNCLQKCVQGEECAYATHCVSPLQERSFYEKNTVSALVVCLKFKN